MERTRKCYRLTDRWMDSIIDRQTDGHTMGISIIQSPLRGGCIKKPISAVNRCDKIKYVHPSCSILR